MKNLMNLGKTLNKNEQKMINGGAGCNCSTYSGPSYYGAGDCIAFLNLPPYHQCCAMVSIACFGI